MLVTRKVTRVHCLQAIKGDCSSCLAGMKTVIVMLVMVFLSDVSSQQIFLEQGALKCVLSQEMNVTFGPRVSW